MLDDHGWAQLVVVASDAVASDAQEESIRVSWLHDSLRELIDAARAVVDGGLPSPVRFIEEPGHCRFVFAPAEDGAVLLDLIRSPWFLSSAPRPEREEELAFTARCEREAFARAVADAAEALLDDHGLAGYRRRWQAHDFPTTALGQLQDALPDRGDPEPIDECPPRRRAAGAEREAPPSRARTRHLGALSSDVDDLGGPPSQPSW